MAVFTDINGTWEKTYEGKVLHWYEQNGYHDSDWYADVWDEENRAIKSVCFMTTRCACSGYAELDATDDVLRQVYRYTKRMATSYYDFRNEEDAKTPHKGDIVRVVRGRKLKKGMEVPVFWAGTRYNPYSRQNEERIGVEVDGDRVFTSADNVEVVGWKDKLVTGRKRKDKIRFMTLNMMPMAYRNYFGNPCKIN